MRNLFLSGLLLFFTNLISAQYSFEWAVGCKGNTPNYGRGITVDKWGNLYRYVNLTGTVDLDPGPGVTNLSSAGSSDVAIVKLDSTGTFMWAKRFGGTGAENARSIIVDSNGFVYTTGNYHGTVDFDPGPVSYPFTTPNSDGYPFVSKLDSGGNFVWARVLSTGSCTPTDLAVDGLGNVYITGDFSDSVDFDPGAGEFWLNNQTFAAGFLLKFDSTGSFVWAKDFKPSPYNNAGVLPYTVAVSASSVAIAGTYADTVDFNPGAGTSLAIAPPAGGYFICKLDTAGNYLSKNVAVTASTGVSYINTLAADNNNNFYGIGRFNFTLNGSTGSGNPSKMNVFIQKMGGTSWSKMLEDNNGIDGYGVAVNDSGNILYAVGSFRDTLLSGALTITSGGSIDIYLLALNANNGGPLWTKKLGGTGVDEALSVTVDRQDNVYFSGIFANTVNFNPVFGTFNLVSSNGGYFIEKLSRCTLPSISLINGPGFVCHNTINTYSVPPVPGAIQYTWALPNSWTGVLDSNVINPLAKKTSTLNGSVKVTVGTTCGVITKSLGVATDSVPTQPGTISGYVAVCSTGGDTLTYSVTQQSNVASYNWSLPPGWTGTSTTNSISVVTDTSIGTISVTPQNACGAGKPRSLVLQSISSVPAMPTASAMDTLICVTTNKTFSVNAVPTAVNYTWTLPAGFTDSSKTTSILIHPVSPGGIITVTANNACGSSTPLVRPLTVYTAPATLPVITGNSAVCTNTTNTYSVTPAPAVTTSYTWCNLPSGCVTNTNPTCSYLKTSNYTVSVTYSNVCGSKTLTKSVTVTPLPTAANNLNWVIPLCPNSSKQFNSSGSANATSYTWTYPADWTGPTTTTTGSNTFTIGEISGNVTVKANNSCGSSAVYSEYVNAVGPPPTVSNISGPTVVCYDSTYTYSVAQSAQIVSYYWSIPSGWTALSSILQHQVTIKPGPNGGVIQAKGSNGACSAGPYQSLSVNVQCAPVNTSIDELTETGTFILPNPSTGILHISSPYQSYKNLAVYSLTGSLVYFTTSTETTIDLSDKPKGLYFVHVLETNNRKAVYKIILE